jgi:Na+/melibiose symporter-like transporter
MSDQLNRSTLAAFAAPAAPISALGLPLAVYLPPFYAEEMGLGLTLVGTVFMITRFWDVLTDPVLGVISDGVRSRWGRRRHWLVLSVPIVVVAVYQVFLPEPPVSAAYLLGWMFILYVGWTLLTLSHMSWGAELTPDYHERSRVQAWREIFLIAGMVTVLALPVLIERAAHDSAGTARVAAMGWFIMVLLPLTVALAVLRVPERDGGATPHLTWRRAAAIVAANRPLRWILLMDLIAGLAGGVVASLFLFVAADHLGLGGIASALLLLYFLSGCVFVVPMIRLSYRFGKHRTLAGSAAFNGLTLPLLLLVPAGDVALAIILFIAYGVNMGVGPVLFRSMMADVADEDHAESGAQRTGLYYALLVMTNKVGQALSIGIIYPILGRMGYVPGAENSAAAIAGLVSIYVWLPAVCSLIVAAAMWRFPLDHERQRELRRVIEEREVVKNS